MVCLHVFDSSLPGVVDTLPTDERAGCKASHTSRLTFAYRASDRTQVCPEIAIIVAVWAPVSARWRRLSGASGGVSCRQ
jgi:hypothetical protein